MLISTQINYVIVWQFMDGLIPVGRRIASAVYIFMSFFIAFGMVRFTRIELVINKRRVTHLLVLTICLLTTVSSLFAYTSGPSPHSPVCSEDIEALSYIVNDARQNYCIIADKTTHVVHRALADHSIYYRANTHYERIILLDLETESYYQIVSGKVNVLDTLENVMNKTGTSLCYLLVVNPPSGLTDILRYTRIGRWYIFKYDGQVLKRLVNVDLYSDDFTTTKYLSDAEIIENIEHVGTTKPFLGPVGTNTIGKLIYSFSVLNDTETFRSIDLKVRGLSFGLGNPLIVSISVDNGSSWDEICRLDNSGSSYVWRSTSYACNATSFKLRFDLVEDSEIKSQGGYSDVRLASFTLSATVVINLNTGPQ